MASGGVHAAGKAVAQSDRIVTAELDMQGWITQIRVDQQDLATNRGEMLGYGQDVNDFPSAGPVLVIVNVLGKPFSVENINAVHRDR